MKEKSIILEAKEVLIETINVLNFDDYTQKINLLSNSSIGEHTRHIYELFQQLLDGYETAIVDYDNRKRNLDLELSIDYAVESLANIICELEKENKILKLNTIINNQDQAIETNYFRELMYNIEHCVHHQAIIKIACLSLGKTDIPENFGVAKSTIKYKNLCVQ